MCAMSMREMAVRSPEVGARREQSQHNRTHSPTETYQVRAKESEVEVEVRRTATYLARSQPRRMMAQAWKMRARRLCSMRIGPMDMSASRLRSWKGVDDVKDVLMEFQGCRVAARTRGSRGSAREWQRPLELEGEC